METRSCIICGCKLESVFGDETHFQPYKGGEVVFHFHYGSCKFDLNMFGTKFAGIICDDCAEKCIERMEMVPDVRNLDTRLPTCFSDTLGVKSQGKESLDKLKKDE